MNDRETFDMDAAVATLDALHSALTLDLEDLETRLRTMDRSNTAAPDQDTHRMAQYHEARTALHSVLASIAEVLGWIQWKTEEDPDGDVAVARHSLPTRSGYLIH